MSDRRWPRVDWRVQVTAAAGIVIAIAMVMLGMEPRLVLVGLVVMAVGAVVWLTIDLSAVAAPVVWTDLGPAAGTATRADRRVHELRSQLLYPSRRRRTTDTHVDTDDHGDADAEGGGGVGGDEADDDIVRTLVGVVDDHLRAEFGVERAHDPDAAAALLGSELTALATDSAAQRRMTGRRGLARTVTVVEAFCARTTTSTSTTTSTTSTTPRTTT